MNSGSPGGICTLPLLCEKILGEPPLGGRPSAPSAYAPGHLMSYALPGCSICVMDFPAIRTTHFAREWTRPLAQRACFPRPMASAAGLAIGKPVLALDRHLYMLYMAVRPSTDITFTAVSGCVEGVARWLLENALLLDPAETEASVRSRLRPSEIRYRLRAALTSQGGWSRFATPSSCSVSHLTQS